MCTKIENKLLESILHLDHLTVLRSCSCLWLTSSITCMLNSLNEMDGNLQRLLIFLNVIIPIPDSYSGIKSPRMANDFLYCWNIQTVFLRHLKKFSKALHLILSVRISKSMYSPTLLPKSKEIIICNNFTSYYARATNLFILFNDERSIKKCTYYKYM